MRARLMATILVLALPLAACASSDDAGAGGQSSAPAQSLAGTAWDLAQYAPAGSTALTSVPVGVKATAEFTADQIAGSSGCNRFTGGYTTDGSTIDDRTPGVHRHGVRRRGHGRRGRLPGPSRRGEHVLGRGRAP